MLVGMKRTALVLTLATFLASSPLWAAEKNDLLNMYQGYSGDSQLALDRPHRSASELSDWISETAANALLFTPGQSVTKLNQLRPLFTAQGYTSYLNFLASKGLIDPLKTQTLSLSTIVSNAPLLIGQGASAGRYAWAFEVPVVLSVGRPATNTPAILRIQFGRAANGAKPHGLLIENWQEYNAEAASGTQPAQDGGQPPTTP